MKIKKGLALRIKQEYAGNKDLCLMLDRAIEKAEGGEMLEVETSIEWQLRGGCQFTPSPEEVVHLFNKGSGVMLAIQAAQCLRRKQLLDEYFAQQDKQTTVPQLETRPAQPETLRRKLFRIPIALSRFQNIF